MKHTVDTPLLIQDSHIHIMIYAIVAALQSLIILGLAWPGWFRDSMIVAAFGCGALDFAGQWLMKAHLPALPGSPWSPAGGWRWYTSLSWGGRCAPSFPAGRREGGRHATSKTLGSGRAAPGRGSPSHPDRRLVKQTDLIRSTLNGATQFFLRRITIGKDDLARIRQEIDFSPEDPDVSFYLGKTADGQTKGVVFFPQVNTVHGPIEVGAHAEPRRHHRERSGDQGDGGDQALGGGSGRHRPAQTVSGNEVRR